MGERDLRIDFLRGIALLMISIDHGPLNALSLVTIHAYSFGDAAELFFFMSGYVAALVYGRAMSLRGFGQTALRIWRRAGALYATQIGLLISVGALLYRYAIMWEDTSVIDGFRLWPLVVHPATTMMHAAALRYQPTYMDILPGYIAIFLALPFMLWLMQKNVWMALGLSFTIYLGVQFEGWTLYTTPHNETWLFNPFAWQFLLVLGAAFGSGRLEMLKPWLRWWPVVTAALIVAAGIALKVGTAAWHEFVPQIPSINFADISNEKSPLQPTRILSFLSLALLAWRFMPSGATLRKFRLARAVMTCGQQSLSVFSASIILSALASILWGDWTSQIAVSLATAGGVVALIGFALVLDWNQKVGFRRLKPQAAAA